MIQSHPNPAITNLKKARGQIDRIIRMIDEGRYCVDIIQQVNAALGLLRKTNNYILERHLITCGTKELSKGSKKSKEDFVREIVRVCSIAGR